MATPRLTRAVPASLDGERADKVVAVLGDMSRSVARSLVDAGTVEADGVIVSAKDRLAAGTAILFPPAPEAPPLEAEEVDFGVVHVDEHLIVVDKPPGLVVHPGAGRATGTLAAGLLGRFPEVEGVGQEGRWGIVHRLDRDTSGLVVVARSAPAYEQLTAAMRRRRIERTYLAGVNGCFSIPRGTVDAPIGRDPVRPMRRALLPEGRHAVTHYRMIRQWETPQVALVEVRLETGRTHQIRVHMAGIHHPVLGDRTYGRRDPIRVPRMFLHATRLDLSHPITGLAMTFESPLPGDLAAVVEELDIRE